VGLNLVQVQHEADKQHHVKFEGWAVKFDDVPHHSEWIQKSIAKSMEHIFKIQGVNVDATEDWKYKIQGLFTVLLATQDDINASGWISIFWIVPWRSMGYLIWTFFYSFIFPCLGLMAVGLVYGFSKKSKAVKYSLLNVGLFSSGLNLLLIAVAFLFVSTLFTPPTKICNSLPECELYVMRGNVWASWQAYIYYCPDCGDPTAMWNQTGYTAECGACICSAYFDENGQKLAVGECDRTLTQGFKVLAIIFFVVGALVIGSAIYRLTRQTMAYSKDEEQGNDANNNKKGKNASSSLVASGDSEMSIISAK